MSLYNLVILGQTVFDIFEKLISNERTLAEAYPNSANRKVFRLKIVAVSFHTFHITALLI